MAKWMIMTEIGSYEVAPDGQGLCITFPDGDEAKVYHEQFRQLQTLFTTAVRQGLVVPQKVAAPFPPATPVTGVRHTFVPTPAELVHEAEAGAVPGEEALAGAGPGPGVPTEPGEPPPAAGMTSPAAGATVQHPRYAKPIPVMGMREVPTPPEHGGSAFLPGAPLPPPHAHTAARPANPNATQSLRRTPSTSASMGRRPVGSPPAAGIPNVGTGAVAPGQTAPRQGQPQPARPQFTRSIDRMKKV